MSVPLAGVVEMPEPPTTAPIEPSFTVTLVPLAVPVTTKYEGETACSGNPGAASSDQPVIPMMR